MGQARFHRLKQIVPIWKREVWADGGEEWVKPDPVYFQSERHDLKRHPTLEKV
jgi:molybdopterin synthase catalytic subunit